MPPQRQVRADYDARTIVVYQAYSPAIAGLAVQAQRFVPPFSFRRMTWIKPSFLWGAEPLQHPGRYRRRTCPHVRRAMGRSLLTAVVKQ